MNFCPKRPILMSIADDEKGIQKDKREEGTNFLGTQIYQSDYI